MTVEIGLLLAFFSAIMSYAAVSDMLTMTIPNRLSLALLAGFFVFALFFGLPLETIGWHLLAGFMVLVISFGMFAFGWIGGGDAKLAAATAVWCGFPGLLPYSLMFSIFGGALTLSMLAARKYPLPRFAHWPWLLRLHDTKTGIPYGIALAAAGLAVFPEMEILKAALSH
ncbi:MAG: A24 family peptidase [Albidovulum sp.]